MPSVIRKYTLLDGLVSSIRGTSERERNRALDTLHKWANDADQWKSIQVSQGWIVQDAAALYAIPHIRVTNARTAQGKLREAFEAGVAWRDSQAHHPRATAEPYTFDPGCTCRECVEVRGRDYRVAPTSPGASLEASASTVTPGFAYIWSDGALTTNQVVPAPDDGSRVIEW